jgi:hypothetical protein
VKALSLWQPSTAALAYASGVVDGDGWCSPLTLGLRCKDRDFAVAFALSVEAWFGIEVWPRLDERGYWLTRVGNKTGRFNEVLGFEPTTDEQRAAWCRGFFDAEGNAQLTKAKVSANSWHRRVAYFGTDVGLLHRAERHLNRLGIATQFRSTSPSQGHLGTRPVFELRVAPGLGNYSSFCEQVGSTIGRKAAVLALIPKSYQEAGHHARAQVKGAAVRRARRDAGGVY